MEVKLSDNFDRNVLIEGRNKGMGFAFAKQISDNVFETVQPISPCKDYLNDVIYAEKTGVIIPKIYGFLYSKINNIIGETHTNLIIKICKQKGGGDYDNKNFAKERDAFNNNYLNVQDFINQIEDKLNLVSKTTIKKGNDDMFLITFPNYWIDKLYLLSLYTLLIRAYQEYDKSMPFMEYMDKKSAYILDSLSIKPLLPKLNLILKGNMPPQDYNKFDPENSSGIHNSSGIQSTKF